MGAHFFRRLRDTTLERLAEVVSTESEPQDVLHSFLVGSADDIFARVKIIHSKKVLTTYGTVKGFEPRQKKKLAHFLCIEA